MNPRISASQRGFTLLEVLIALAIVAMAVGALLGTITSSASNISYLRSKTIAEWVALNHLTEVRISQQMPDTGRRTGYTVMAGMRWQWEQEVIETSIAITISVVLMNFRMGSFVDIIKFLLCCVYLPFAFSCGVSGVITALFMSAT